MVFFSRHAWAITPDAFEKSKISNVHLCLFYHDRILLFMVYAIIAFAIHRNGAFDRYLYVGDWAGVTGDRMLLVSRFARIGVNMGKNRIDQIT